jgi:hypothetical protein
VHDDVDGGRDLRANVVDRQVDVGHHRHRLQTPEQMERRVGMCGRQRAVVPGVHRLKHVERLAAANLADNDPIRTHAQGVADEVADGDRASTLHVGRSSLEAEHVRLGQPQLGGVLDRDDPFIVRDERRQDAEKRGLPRAGASGHDDVGATPHACREERERPRTERAAKHELLGPERHGRELPDVESRTAERKGRHDRVHPAAVRQSSIHPR